MVSNRRKRSRLHWLWLFGPVVWCWSAMRQWIDVAQIEDGLSLNGHDEGIWPLVQAVLATGIAIVASIWAVRQLWAPENPDTDTKGVSAAAGPAAEQTAE